MFRDYFTEPPILLITEDPNLRFSYALAQNYSPSALKDVLCLLNAYWWVGIWQYVYLEDELAVTDPTLGFYLVGVHRTDPSLSFIDRVDAQVRLVEGSGRLEVLVPRVCKDLAEAELLRALNAIGEA